MRLTPRFSLLAVLAFGLAFTSGCLNGPELRGIAVQLLDIKGKPAAGGGAELTLTIKYLNENLVAVAVSETDHRVFLNDVAIGRIRSEEPVGLPQLASETQELPLTVDADTAARLRQMQASGAANYRLETRLLIEAATDELESNARGSGTVDLSALGL